jgi:hypothetical protein
MLTILQLNNLLKYSDGDRWHPNYKFLGKATGRFSSSKPEFHNLVRKHPKLFIHKGENPEDSNLRNLLLGAPNVFGIDFAQQEDCFSAWLTNERSDIKAIIEGLISIKTPLMLWRLTREW